LRWLVPDISEETIRRAETIARKGWHATEYAVLALLVWHALRKPLKNDPRPWSGRLAARAVFLTGLYASTDEFHQAFIPSRGASVEDVLLDTLGASAGVLLLWWFWGRQKGS